MKGFKVLLGDANTEILTAMRGGLGLLGKIGNTQDEINGAVKSMDAKMDLSLNNDSQIPRYSKGCA